MRLWLTSIRSPQDPDGIPSPAQQEGFLGGCSPRKLLAVAICTHDELKLDLLNSKENTSICLMFQKRTGADTTNSFNK